MKNFLCITTCCIIASVVISLTSCTAQVPKADLKTELDSLSYTTGISYTQGLDQYFMQLGITDEYKADFVKGLIEGLNINQDDKKSQAQMRGKDIGVQLSTQMLPQINMQLFGSENTKSINRDQFMAGFIAGVTRENMLFDDMTAQALSNSLSERLINQLNEKYLIENTAFLDENKKKPGVIVLPSGLQYKVITEGKGAKPTAEDRVKVHYVGTNIHGAEFDSSISRGEPAEFGLDIVIPGWTEGIQLMPVGSKYILYIPYDLAYGEKGQAGSIDPYATLIFEVELLDILK